MEKGDEGGQRDGAIKNHHMGQNSSTQKRDEWCDARLTALKSRVVLNERFCQQALYAVVRQQFKTTKGGILILIYFLFFTQHSYTGQLLLMGYSGCKHLKKDEQTNSAMEENSVSGY